MSKLTPEEELEKELATLSPEQLDQYEQELLASQPQEESPAPQTEPEATIEPEIGAALSTANPMLEQSVEEIVPTEEVMKARGYGIMAGIPQELAVNAITLARGGTENFSERKRANQKQWNDEYDRYMQKYPDSVWGYDIASGALGMTALGITFPFTTGLKASTMLGAAAGYSRTRDKDNLREVGTNVAIGAGLGAAPFAIGKGAQLVGKIGKGVGKGAGALKRGVSHTAHRVGVEFNLLKRESLRKMIGATNTSTKGRWSSHFSKTSASKSIVEAETEGVERLLNATTKDGNLVVVTDSYDQTAINALKAKKEIGGKLGNIVKNMDEDFDKVAADDLKEAILNKVLNKGETEAEQIYNAKVRRVVEQNIIPHKKVSTNSITKYVPEESSILGPDGKPVKKMIEVTERQFEEIPHKYTAQELQKLKLDSADQLAFKPDGTVKVDGPDRAVYEAFREFSDSVLEEASDVYKTVNRDWSDMHILVDTASEAARFDKSTAPRFVKKVAETVATFGRNETVKSNAMKANAVVVGLDAMKGAEGFNPQMEPRIQKIKDYVSIHPDSVYTKRMIMAAMTADHTGNTSYDAVTDTIDAISAEISLMESPLKRNINDIKAKSDLVLDIIDFYSPMQADALREALENRDDESVRMMMDQASKMPEVSQIFEDGRGIDGRVFSEEDKQVLRDEVESMDISLKQKLQHLDQLNKQGLVPQVEEEPERFLKFEKRDKSKPRY